MFQNDFVFAISCLTALEFGNKCVKEGAIAYLGYQVEIGNLFNCYTTSITNLPKRISEAVDLIMKRIFVDALSKSYGEFLSRPISVNTLKERFSYLIERNVVELLTMTIDDIYTKYGVKILENHYKKYLVAVVLKVLSELKEASAKLVCIGEENYISPTFVDHYFKAGFSKERQIEEIMSNHYYQSMSSKYQAKIIEKIMKKEEI